jgi:hypothetical protein
MRVFTTIGGTLAILSLAGCDQKEGDSNGAESPAEPPADSLRSLVEEFKGEYLAYAKTVRSPSDVESAKAAAAKLEEIQENIAEIAERLVRLDVPPEEEGKRYGRQLRDYERKIEEEMGDAEEEAQHLDPEAARILREAMEGFGGRMQELLVVFEEYFRTRRLDD